MSLRQRFVYLVMNDTAARDFPLRRIDAAHLFFPKRNRPPSPPPPEDARLPPPVIRFSAPASTVPGTSTTRGMEFMLLHGGATGGGWRKRPKVVATDHTGRSALYDPARGTVRVLPELAAAPPKVRPAAIHVGEDGLYVIDRHFNRAFSRDDACCFHALLFDPDAGDWHWRSLPPPPYASSYDPDTQQRVRAHITSYAVVNSGGGGGASVWVSKDGLGTHCFDVGTGEWAKAGDWVLPFWGPGTYVPEHKLWFGLSDIKSDEDDGGGVACASDHVSVCAADLTTAAAPPRVLWREPPTPPEWTGRSSFLVHLGCSRFCLARFYKIVHGGTDSGSPSVSRFAVFSGLEVEPAADGEGLRMVKHRSLRFSLVNKLFHWVL